MLIYAIPQLRYMANSKMTKGASSCLIAYKNSGAPTGIPLMAMATARTSLANGSPGQANATRLVMGHAEESRLTIMADLPSYQIRNASEGGWDSRV